jgi:hypothetical protein
MSLFKGGVVKVSSVLDNKVAMYGGQNVLDNDRESSWTSSQSIQQDGVVQTLSISLDKAVTINELSFTFQGGFVAQETELLISDDGVEWTNAGVDDAIDIEDVNEKQIFDLSDDGGVAAQYFKFVFNASSDFYGRVIIYDLRAA